MEMISPQVKIIKIIKKFLKMIKNNIWNALIVTILVFHCQQFLTCTGLFSRYFIHCGKTKNVYYRIQSM